MSRRALVRISLLAGTLAMASIPATAQPGQLIAAQAVPETPPGTQAWKVRYLTTDDRGHQREVTGMVIAPREAVPARPRPVIAWTHGTWGVAEACAPSLSARFFEATPAIEAVRRGYVVVAPD
jgi:hypothetical protein